MMRTLKRPVLAIAAACLLLPLAGCYDDDYGAPRGYGPPPPPPPQQGGYYQGGYQGGPPPQGGYQGGYQDAPPTSPGGYYGDHRAPPPPPPPGNGAYPYREAAPPPPPGAQGGYGNEQPYYADRDYRPEPDQERSMTRDDQVYRGQDGRYYCKRSDGTTGLIVGALAGGLLGNIIDGGRHRALGTLLGAGGGAVAGQAIDQGQVHCQ